MAPWHQVTMYSSNGLSYGRSTSSSVNKLAEQGEGEEDDDEEEEEEEEEEEAEDCSLLIIPEKCSQLQFKRRTGEK